MKKNKNYKGKHEGELNEITDFDKLDAQLIALCVCLAPLLIIILLRVLWATQGWI